MYWDKRIIGDALWARRPATQRREAMIAVNVINRMTGFGAPVSVPVAT